MKRSYLHRTIVSPKLASVDFPKITRKKLVKQESISGDCSNVTPRSNEKKNRFLFSFFYLLHFLVQLHGNESNAVGH